MTTEKIDEELRKAALNGDVGFLKKCVEAEKPIEYYMAFYPKEDEQIRRNHYGNIFHIAAIENKEEFIREAMGMLPLEAKQQLLVQLGDEEDKWNPLHEAAKTGNIEIVNMFLEVYRCLPTLPSDSSKRPWLMKVSSGDNACCVALSYHHEECALEIYRIDTELISNMPSERGASLLYEAILQKMSKLALEILKSPHSISCVGLNELTPFHEINFIEGSDGSEEILRLLLERDLGQIKLKNQNQYSTFNVWATDGKLWPFKVLLDNIDIIEGLNAIFEELISSTDNYGDNPLHDLALNTTHKEEAEKIAELLVNTYKKVSLSLSNNQLPWFVKDNLGHTPFSMALSKKNESIAKYFLSLDENLVIESDKNVLFLAIENECHVVAEEILKIVDNKGWTQILTNDQHLNVLHLAPLCTKYICTQLIEGHPEFIKGVDKEGSTIIHNWIKSDKQWLFELMLESKWKFSFVKLIDTNKYNDQNNVFHVASTTTHKETIQIVQLLVKAYKEKCLNLKTFKIHNFPWFKKNKQDEGPLHLAIRNGREDLALYIMSLHEDDHINELLDYYEPEHSILFLAIQNNCRQVAEKILSRLDKESWTKYLKDPSNGQNILHLAPNLKDEKFGTLLVNEAPEFITEKDNNGQSAWDKAYEIGPAWFIKAVLDKDPSVFNSAPLVWTKACKKGHVPALCAYIEHNPGSFRDLCIKHRDSPLHHIRLKNLSEYEEFLKIIRIKDLINLQDSQGATPLHKAIRNEDLFLTETLLSIDKINYDIEDDEKVSAIDLLAQGCNKNEDWDRMCKRIGLDPRIKTTYFKSKTNLLEVRSSLFVVAALLATITFTAGFTIPGGFNQDNGEALLGTKAAFLVFLISDTLALFFSMLVLICLVWSMVFDPSKSLFLIDRSMVFLRSALNFTLLAFMTGVYIVIAPKSLWAAILIIVIISSLIGISINKTFLYNVLQYLDKSIPSRTKKPKDRICMVEEGITDENAESLDQPSRGDLVRRPSSYRPDK